MARCKKINFVPAFYLAAGRPDNGMQHVLDKITLTGHKPRDNMAMFFLAALHDAFQRPSPVVVSRAGEGRVGDRQSNFFRQRLFYY